MSNTNSQHPNASTGDAHGQASLSQAVFARGESCLSPAAENSNPSTGPRTEAGKAASSRNAVKHNLCSTRLSGPDLEELNAIRARLDEEWEPATETEGMLLDQMALSRWRMERALSLELNAFDDAHIDQPLLALALRYRTTAEGSFYKALAELQRLRTAMREDALRQEKEQEAAVHREMERLCFAPIAGARQFVSQTPSPAPPAGAQPDPEAARTFIDAKIREARSQARRITGEWALNKCPPYNRN
jgi:hypothetical protein